MPSLLDLLGETWPARMAKSAYGAVTLPGDVYAGRVDPLSEEGIGRAADLGGMVMGGTYAGAPAGAMGAGVVKPLRAYHGSPHDFERFDLSKIGTGEGAQAYGHGLYFAENPAVAKEYRDVLTRRPVNDAGIDPAVAGGAVFDIAAKAGDLINGKIPFGPTRSLLTRDQIVSGFQEGKYSPFDLSPAMQRQIVDHIKPPGRMYEVNINAAPEQFLNHDVPIAQQSPEVQKALGSYLGGAYLETPNIFPRSLVPTGVVGSKSLADAGIPGIKYLDQGSRSAGYINGLIGQYGSREKALEVAKQKLGEASTDFNRQSWQKAVDQLQRTETSNYVLFRDDIIDIVKKYGLAGAAAMYGISQDEAKAAMEGGDKKLNIGRQSYGNEE